MTVPRSVRLSPAQLQLKIATDEAMRAVGGQLFLAAHTGRAQSCFSDWGSRKTATFMPIDFVATVEDLGDGAPGHPHITRALARRQGFDLYRLPPVEALDSEFGRHGARLMKEAGEVMARLGEALADDDDVDAAEARAALTEARELLSVVVALVTALEARAGLAAGESEAK